MKTWRVVLRALEVRTIQADNYDEALDQAWDERGMSGNEEWEVEHCVEVEE